MIVFPQWALFDADTIARGGAALVAPAQTQMGVFESRSRIEV
jgi:hypothetical protein